MAKVDDGDAVVTDDPGRINDNREPEHWGSSPKPHFAERVRMAMRSKAKFWDSIGTQEDIYLGGADRRRGG